MEETYQMEGKCITIANEYDEIIEETDDEKSKQYFVMRNFIAAYESLPELWNQSYSLYTNRKARNNALDKLVEIYRDLKPRAQQEDVKRKINTLRSNYWKLWKKVEQSRLTAQNENEIYQPTSWVFHALRFLGDLDPTVGGTPKKRAESPSETNISAEVVTTEDIKPVRCRRRIRKRIMKPVNPANYSLWNKVSHERDWDGPTVAKVWGEKLVDLDPQQRLFAEKAINDILFEANMGCLHRYSVKINEDSSRADHNYQQAVGSFSHPEAQHFVATAESVNGS
ncbi:uncharacterized protein LOC131687232 [Topomyia yanbarensis]|uniref:uncharacterized protein LOC131687232 n=1 Tax=Topomyia yanbarensis TaxID=2498891 RepID=UPI00273BC137|nr:uncharacterized protein LOC131687232 [Topomyia yanbarensis]